MEFKAIDFVFIITISLLTQAFLEFIRYKINQYKENVIYKVYINDEFLKECTLKEGKAIYESSEFEGSKGLGINKKSRIVDISIDKY